MKAIETRRGKPFGIGLLHESTKENLCRAGMKSGLGWGWRPLQESVGTIKGDLALALLMAPLVVVVVVFDLEQGK